MPKFQKNEMQSPVNNVNKKEFSSMNRRTALGKFTLLAAASALPNLIGAKTIENMPLPISTIGNRAPLRKIATEEAFNIPEIADAIMDVVRRGGKNLDLMLLKQIYSAPRSFPNDAELQNNQ